MLIFVSSIGRSGTRYLAELVRAMASIPAHHLARPYCHGEVYEAVNRGEERPDLALKVAQVTAEAAAEGRGGWYFESSPVFVRGFSGAVLDAGREVGVIQLLRDPMEVAKSYCNRDSYPSHPGRPWRLPLNLSRSLLRIEGGEPLTPFQENLADWLENELRLAKLRPRLARAAPLRFGDLARPERLRELLAGWGVPLRESGTGGGAMGLERNANAGPTEVDERDREEAERLLERLGRCEFEHRVFADEIYDGWEFVERLRKGGGRG